MTVLDVAARAATLSREEKLALIRVAATNERDRRRNETTLPAADGSQVVRVRARDGRLLSFRLSADDIAL